MTTASVAAPERSLQSYLTERAGRGKLLMPYVTAGVTPDWLELVDAVIDAGADAVEIGIPFSDPAIDGTTIQEATVVALEAGMTPAAALQQLKSRRFGVPLIAMTHYNLVYRYGHERFAADLVAAGGWATILPDLPFEHAGEWIAAADAEGIENVLLAAPVTSDERLAMVVEKTGGFVYVVSTMGTTGARAGVDSAATVLARRVKSITDKPAVVGFGISSAETAVTAAREADGVIVASALMRRVLDGATVEDAAQLVAEIRAGLDAAYATQDL
ncbi:MAG: tryptophan synthase subunit alpha [Acidimicrobiales bacterium]|nr:tryptophan synthase subunit alpha [Acidimicrobiales bacterium]